MYTFLVIKRLRIVIEIVINKLFKDRYRSIYFLVAQYHFLSLYFVFDLRFSRNSLQDNMWSTRRSLVFVSFCSSDSSWLSEGYQGRLSCMSYFIFFVVNTMVNMAIIYSMGQIDGYVTFVTEIFNKVLYILCGLIWTFLSIPRLNLDG